MALALVSLALFAGSLDGGFLYDDLTFVQAAADSNARTLDPAAFHADWARWVRTLTLALDRALFGNQAAGYHLHNLLWHAASVCLLYLLVLRLAASAGLALATALLFAVHPIHVEAVVSITNRKELLCLAFSLLSLLAYLRFLERRQRRWLAAAATACVLAVGSKQVGIVLPLVVLALEWCFVPRERRFALARPGWTAGVAGGFGALLVVYTVAHVGPGDLATVGTLDGYRGEPSYTAFWLTSARAFWIDLRLLLWPLDPCPDRVVTLSQTLADPVTLVAWLGLLAWLPLAFAVARRDRALGFGLLWIAIQFLPIANWVPLSYVVADRYLYIPSAGFCLVVARGGERLLAWLAPRLWLPPARVAAVLLGAAALPLGGLTLAQQRPWESNRALWTHMQACSPDSWRAHLGLANESLREGDHRTAERLLRRTIELAPGLTEAHYNLALLRSAAGDGRGALQAFDRALALRPDLALAHHGRALALERLGRHEAAHRAFARAVELDAGLVPALLGLAGSHERRGEPQAARPLYERASQLGSAAGRAGLARLDALARG